jgi:hypothetical protein
MFMVPGCPAGSYLQDFFKDSCPPGSRNNIPITFYLP